MSTQQDREGGTAGGGGRIEEKEEKIGYLGMIPNICMYTRQTQIDGQRDSQIPARKHSRSRNAHNHA